MVKRDVYKRQVLTGVNLGDFGNGTEVIEGLRPKKEAMFIDLIRALDEIKEISRYRISSIEPNLCTDEVIEFVASSRAFLPHFHIPLQSGSPKILREMKRRYTVQQYEERIKTIKKWMPHSCIGVDVIVGFPGEGHEEFTETYEFLHRMDVSYFHVFTYSERNNTLASEMKNVVPMEIRRERNESLRILSQKKKNYFVLPFTGQKFPVLWENTNDPSIMSGYTPNFKMCIRDSFYGHNISGGFYHTDDFVASGIILTNTTYFSIGKIKTFFTGFNVVVQNRQSLCNF